VRQDAIKVLPNPRMRAALILVVVGIIAQLNQVRRRQHRRRRCEWTRNRSTENVDACPAIVCMRSPRRSSRRRDRTWSEKSKG